MRKGALGSLGFFLLAPGLVAGLTPWLVTDWEGSPPGLDLLDLAGSVVAILGVLVVVTCFLQFVGEGHGTPAPVAPTDTLVVGGLYRHVRNPMYVGVGAAIAGQAVIFRSVGTALELVLFVVAVTAFVRGYEQPTLSRQFGASYDRYRREVPAWWPRWRSWR